MDNNGISFHRYQMFIWTMILVIIFLYRFITHLEFPVFEESLLTLQGISSGTYLGFKIPEPPKESSNQE